MPSRRPIEFSRPGILNENQLKELISADYITNGNANGIDGSAIDLHVGDTYWKLPAGLKGRKDKKVSEILTSAKSCGIESESINRDGVVLEKGDIYLFALKESINFHGDHNLYGHGTGKSSIGRLDILTRLLVDYEARYDQVCTKDYKDSKNLYVEITPLSFPIKIYPDVGIYQLRIACGDLRTLLIKDDLVNLYTDIYKSSDPDRHCTQLTLNLEPANGDVIAYRARRDLQCDVAPLEINAEVKTYDPSIYWEKIRVNDREVIEISRKRAIKIEANAFYILGSCERFTLPADLAVYALAMTEEVGELRIHHAGFIHPKFGMSRRNKGTPLIYEVRGHDVDMFLVHGDLMAELRYYPMSEPSKIKPSPYDKQELKLSKIFKDFTDADRNTENR
jgi:dCTP deaminase